MGYLGCLSPALLTLVREAEGERFFSRFRKGLSSFFPGTRFVLSQNMNKARYFWAGRAYDRVARVRLVPPGIQKTGRWVYNGSLFVT